MSTDSPNRSACALLAVAVGCLTRDVDRDRMQVRAKGSGALHGRRQGLALLPLDQINASNFRKRKWRGASRPQNLGTFPEFSSKDGCCQRRAVSLRHAKFGDALESRRAS